MRPELVSCLFLGNVSQQGGSLKSTGRHLFPPSAIFLRSSSFSFLPPASENSNKRHAVTQMRSSAVTRRARELFSNSGSDKEEKEEKNTATGAIFTIQPRSDSPRVE